MLSIISKFYGYIDCFSLKGLLSVVRYILSLVAVASLAGLAAGVAAAAGPGIYLSQGDGYPICVAMVAALHQMPASTDVEVWPQRLPPIAGVTHLRWMPLDPSQNLDAIHDFMIKEQRESRLDKRTDEVIWTDIGPKIEQDIRSGKVRLEELTISGVKLGVPSQTVVERPWTTDVRFVRVGYIGPSSGTIGLSNLPQPGRSETSWAYMAASFSLFPDVHDVLVEAGGSGFDIVLVGRQPWFVASAGVVSIPFTSDLANRGPSADHRLLLDQRCLIHFPYKLRNGRLV